MALIKRRKVVFAARWQLPRRLPTVPSARATEQRVARKLGLAIPIMPLRADMVVE